MTMSLIVDFPHMPNATDLHTTKKKRRTVRFSHNSMLHCFEACQDPGTSSWFSCMDKQRFKQEAKHEIATFQRMKESGCDINRILSSDSTMCLFGLEQQLVSREFTKKRLITRRLVTLDVLAEQDRHLSCLAEDEQERIAAASRRHSDWSIVQALTIGSFQAMSQST